MDFIQKYSGVVALVILAIMNLGGWMGGTKALFGSTSCGSITCLSGGLRLVTDAGGDFEADVASVFAGAVSLTSTLTVGSGGTAVSKIVSGTCNLSTGTGALNVIAGFKTVNIDCGSGTNGGTAISALPASATGDRMFVEAPTTTPATLNSLIVNGAAASSTAGFVTLTLTNASSSAITLTSSATSSWQYHLER